MPLQDQIVVALIGVMFVIFGGAFAWLTYASRKA